MAFRTESLHSAGGFDPYLGAGTRTHGCEETRVLSSLLSEGHAILHWPSAEPGTPTDANMGRT